MIISAFIIQYYKVPIPEENIKTAHLTVRKMYSKIADSFYQTEFFRHHKPASKLLYFLYSISTGMYYENYMRSRFKYLLSIVQISSITCIVANCLITLFQLQTLELPVILVAMSALAFQLSICSITIITYSWRDKLRYLLEAVNTLEAIQPVYTPKDEDKKYEVYDFVKNFTIFSKYFIIFTIILLWLGKITFILIIKGTPIQINRFYDYVYPFPLVKSSRISVYVLMYQLQSVTLLLPTISIISSTILLLSYPCFFKNQSVLLKREIRQKSRSTFQVLEQVYKDDDELVFKSCETTKRCEISKKFTTDIIKWIQRYQKLISCVNLLRGYFEAVLNMNIFSTMVPIIFLTYVLSKDWSDMPAIYFMYLAEVMILLLVNCLFGNIFQQINDGLAEEIYGTPWYHFAPEQRKLLLNFLTLTRNFRAVHVFKVYPISLELYPKILGKLFSYVQIMRGMEKRA